MSTKCPYCAAQLDTTPKRKTRCPHCKPFIFVRAGRLLTEDEASTEDWLARLAPFGISKAELEGHRQQLSSQLGSTASITDTVWQFLNVQASGNHAPQIVQIAYNEMARLASIEEKDPKPYLIEALKTQLEDLKSKGVKTVKIIGTNDDITCKNCKSLQGKEFNIDTALRDMPIPTNCESEFECRCSYVQVSRIRRIKAD